MTYLVSDLTLDNKNCVVRLDFQNQVLARQRFDKDLHSAKIELDCNEIL